MHPAAVANPIEDNRQILHQIIISRIAKLNSLHITLLVASSCIGVGLAVHTPFQPTVTPTVELIPSSYPNVLVRVITDRVRLIKCMNRASLYLFSPRVDVVFFHLVQRLWMQQLQLAYRDLKRYLKGQIRPIFIPKLLLRCGLLAWTWFRLILRNVLSLSGL